MRNRRLPDEIYNERWIKRIQSRCVVTDAGCLLWNGQLTYNGYGQDQYRAKTKSLHRQMYKVVRGVQLTNKQYVCHSCDNRNCLNVAHMWIGSAKDNQQDMSRKGRAGFQSKTHCLRGHEFTPGNTKRYPSTGRRTCLTCERIRYRMRAGWSTEQAEGLPITPHGYRPVGGNFKRRGNGSDAR